MYKNLKALRERLNMTQEDFGRSIGLAKSTYNNYETGVREPKSDFWVAIAKRYEVSIDFLMGFSDSPGGYMNPWHKKEGAPVLSTGAQRVAMAYDELSQWGQKQVRTVVDNELERMSDGLRSLQDLDPPPGKVIYVFLDPAWVINEDDDESVVDAYTLQENDPPQAEYGMMPALYSMGPDFPARNVVFVNHEPMADGDIGVFYYENETVIRQWHEDKYGIYLLTLDRKCADKDIVIPRNKRDQSEIHAHYVWGKHLVWLGRVITRKRYEVPPHQLISDDENRPG